MNVVTVWNRLRESYWFIPAVMSIAAIVLAFLTDYIDAEYGTDFLSSISWLYKSQPEGARALLTAIATSAIGVAGVTFSMTIVSVSFAATNFGPRLVGNFMRDAANQVTLGTFIATFVYCLLILRSVTGGAGQSVVHVPNVSMLVALLLTLASVSVLIFFIHHIPESINVGRLTADIGERLCDRVDNLFADAASANEDAPDAGDGGSIPHALQQELVSPCAGYLESIDYEALLTAAKEADVVLRISCRPGEFVVKGRELLQVSGHHAMTEDLRTCAERAFLFGDKRTDSQDVLFLVDQLVEIMARALSPGVNDPFTAINCMNWLHAAMNVLVNRSAPGDRCFDDENELRLILMPMTFERFSRAVFAQPLQYIAEDRNAALHMMQMLTQLIAVTRSSARQQILLVHAEHLSEGGRLSLPLVSDQLELERRFRVAQRLAATPGVVHNSSPGTSTAPA